MDDFPVQCVRCGRKTGDETEFLRSWSVGFDADLGSFPYCPSCSDVLRRRERIGKRTETAPRAPAPQQEE